jgi:N-acetylglutamate synthase-like GNAT family acetyltransferase
MSAEYTFSNDKNKLDIKVIHDFLSNSYWAKDIPVEIVKCSIENSLCFGVYHNDPEGASRQIGFARVISDFASFGYLADVFVVEEYRGKGISKKLMQQIMAHPQLQGLRRFCLATRDAHKLYEQFGFKELAHPDRLMEIVVQNIYSAKNN